MIWLADFLPLAEWALRQQDLRHRYLFAGSGAEVMSSPGIACTLEAIITLAIYEAALGKGYIDGTTIGYEKPYPRSTGGNPKRADLAFKDRGKGKNWAYIEIKYYGSTGKKWVQHDIEKLRTIKQRSQRWLFLYRVRPIAGRCMHLPDLIVRNFGGHLRIQGQGTFVTVADKGNAPAMCEFCFARVEQ